MQRTALEAAGCTAIYVSTLDTMDEFIFGLRKPGKGSGGDIVLVTTLARLAGRRDALNAAIAAIHSQGAVIIETSTSRRSDDANQLQSMIFEAVDEITSDRKALTAKQAKKFGSKGGKSNALRVSETRAPEAAAKAAWHGNNHLSNDEVLALPELDGWGLWTAYRKFGKRNRMIGVRVGRPRKLKR